jgi:hypothetical protein
MGRGITGLAALLWLALIVAVAGCGSSARIRVSRGVIHVDRGVQFTALTKSVGSIKIGTPSAVVRSRLGVPEKKDPTGAAGAAGLVCWWYRAEQPNSSLDGLGFCLNSQQRVERIVLAEHL